MITLDCKQGMNREVLPADESTAPVRVCPLKLGVIRRSTNAEVHGLDRNELPAITSHTSNGRNGVRRIDSRVQL